LHKGFTSTFDITSKVSLHCTALIIGIKSTLEMSCDL
jgi:hypothetical protein